MKVEKSPLALFAVSLAKLKRRRSKDDSIVDIADRIVKQRRKPLMVLFYLAKLGR